MYNIILILPFELGIKEVVIFVFKCI